VVGVIPIGIVVLRGQAIGVDRRMDRPWVNLFQRKILIYEKNSVAVFLEQSGKKRGVHARAERTLEIVIVYNCHLSVLIAARRPPAHIDLLRGTRKRNRQRIIVWKLTRPQRPQRHLYIRRKLILRPHMPLNHLSQIRRSVRSGRSSSRGRSLRRAAQANHQKNEKRTPHNHEW